MARGLAHARQRHGVILAAGIAALLATDPLLAQLRAFPEAEGFGAGATGGRGGSVYHVTNLNDSGVGSFRDAVSVGNRTVVFDVGGWIDLQSVVPIRSNITIAGQTAPGQGIGLRNFGVSSSNASNIIVRHIRSRQGPYQDSVGQDAFGGTNINNAIFDHVSSTWGRDENFSVTNSTNVTIQNSIIAEGLLNHSMGGLIEWNNGISIHHSLYVSNNDRNPKTKGVLDFVNNVVFNWGAFAYVAGDSAGLSYGNVVGNTFIAGPSSSELHDPISRGNANYSIYLAGNYWDGNLNGVLDGHLLTQAEVDDDVTFVAERFPYPQITTDDAVAAYERVLARAGPSINRDSVDARLVNLVRTQSGSLIRDPADVGGWGSLAGGVAPLDTDQDGMPNTWESERGLDPDDAADRNHLNLFGYTRLEEYINELGGAHTPRVATGPLNVWHDPATWSGGTVPTIDDTAYVRGGSAGAPGRVVVDQPGAVAWDVRIGGTDDAAAEELVVQDAGELRVRNTLHVGYQDAGRLTVQSGGQVEARHVVLGSFQHAGAVNVNDGGRLRTSMIASDGQGGLVTLRGGAIEALGQLTVSAPVEIVLTGTINTSGHDATITSVINGSGKLIKTGVGTLTLANVNTHTGGTTLAGGTLAIGSHDNIGGAASPITFEGGTLRLTGTAIGSIGSHLVNWSSFDGGIDVADPGHTFFIAHALAGTGGFTKAGAGTLVMQSAASTYSGGTTVAGGVLSVDSSAMLGGAAAPLTLAGGILRFTTATTAQVTRPTTLVNASAIDVSVASGTVTMTEPIVGAGWLSKLGPGRLILGAANAFTGPFTIAAGPVQITNANALQFSTVNLAGGTLELNGLAASLGGLGGAGNIDLKGTKLVLGGSNENSTFAGVLSSSAGVGSVEKIGTGTINLSGNNTYTGGTVLKGGAIGITTAANIGGVNSGITFSGGLLRINGTTLTNLNGHAVNWSSFNGGFDIAAAGHTFTVSQSIGSTTGSVTKAGPGVLTLAGLNTYNGGTFLKGGTLGITSLDNVSGPGKPLTFAGGLLRVTGTAIPNLNTMLVNWTTFDGGFDVATSGATLSVGQVIGGTGSLTKAGVGTLALSSANTFTGDTFLNAGTLSLTNADALRFSTLVPGGGAVTIGVTNFINVGGLRGSGALALGGYSVNVGTNDRDMTYSGVLSATNAGQGQFNKVGSGTLALTGASSYTRPIVIRSGAIAVASLPNASLNSPLGFGATAASLVLDGGRLVYSSGSSATSNRLFTIGPAGGTIECAGAGALTLNATGTVAQAGTGDRALTLTGVNADCGFSFGLGDPTGGGRTSLRKDEGGRWIMNGAANTLTYSGDTVIEAGILILNGNVRLPFGAGKGNLVINAGQFEMNGRDLSINGLFGAGNIQNRSNTRTLTLGNADAGGDFAGVVSNTGGGASTQLLNVMKIGSGTQVFRGFNTYGGATTVNAGTLTLASRSAAGFSSIVANGGTLRIEPGEDAALLLYKTFTIGGPPAAPTAKVDLASGAFIVSKTAGNALASLAAWTVAGRAGGAWTGNGIASSFAAANPSFAIAVVDNAVLGRTSFRGQSVSPDSLLVAIVRLGDTNLDRAVNFDDLLSLAQHYGEANAARWTDGDFDLDGGVNFDDLLALAQNYGTSSSSALSALPADAFAADWALAQSLVPEPASFGLCTLIVSPMLRRRRPTSGRLL